MVGKLLFVCFVAIGSSCSAQDQYIQPGLLAASITYSPSTMLNHNQSNYYANGFAEYWLDDHYSFRGDTYLFLNSPNENSLIKDGLRSYFGVAYHAYKGNWDGHIGFQPGISVLNTTELDQSRYIQPSAAFRVGTTYYLWKYFHFFANLTYVRSKLLVNARGPFQADELIFSAGLGFQIQTRKK